MSNLKNALVASMRTLPGMIKHYWGKIDWELVQILVLVGMLPTMLIVGALFPSFLTPYYED